VSLSRRSDHLFVADDERLRQVSICVRALDVIDMERLPIRTIKIDLHRSCVGEHRQQMWRIGVLSKDGCCVMHVKIYMKIYMKIYGLQIL
jgi:hypothetical protein